MYIHIYIYMETHAEPAVRPVHLLRVSLLGVLESRFPGDPL